MGLTYDDVITFSQSSGAVYFSVMFAIVCIYALWPTNRAKFDKAAQIPLSDDEDAP